MPHARYCRPSGSTSLLCQYMARGTRMWLISSLLHVRNSHWPIYSYGNYHIAIKLFGIQNSLVSRPYICSVTVTTLPLISSCYLCVATSCASSTCVMEEHFIIPDDFSTTIYTLDIILCIPQSIIVAASEGVKTPQWEMGLYSRGELYPR